MPNHQEKGWGAKSPSRGDGVLHRAQKQMKKGPARSLSIRLEGAPGPTSQ